MTSQDGIEQQAVREQLAHMLAHTAFSGAPRLSSLLRFLVGETLDGRGNQLKEYTLGVAVFGRGNRFDPRLDSIVRVEASKLRTRLATYYKDAGANDPILIELPRGSYAPRIMPRDRAKDATRPAGAIAVLPFINLGPEVEAEYLSDGLTEEIIDRLGTIPGMRVVARTSAFQFKNKSGNIQEIGRVLGADYLMEGSIQKSSDRFQIRARLIDAATGYRVWSHAYDEKPGDIFRLQTAIADAIGVAFGGKISLVPEKGGRSELSVEAYHLYLRGRFHRNQWTLEGCEKSIECLEGALSLEPESAQILAALSEAQVLRTLVAAIPATRHMDMAREAAERAIALDDCCALAHLSLGWVLQIYDWQWEAALAELGLALEVNPSFAEAWHLKGIFLALRQRTAEAEASFQRAREFDPLSLVIQAHAALPPYFAGNFAEALSRAHAALALESLFPETHWVLGWIYEAQHRYQEALEEFQKTLQLGGENPTILGDIAFLHGRLGDGERAREIAVRLETGFPRPHPAGSSLARVYFGLGENQRANAWLEEAWEARDLMLPWACVDRRYQEMWSLPAFSSFREQILGLGSALTVNSRLTHTFCPISGHTRHMPILRSATWLLALACAIPASAAPSFHPQIPKTWDDAKISNVEIPLSHPDYSPKHMAAEFYYRMPVRPIYQSYPVYHPDREPPGYLKWLAQREPELIWNSSKLQTREDWIQAGKTVFEAPIAYGAIGMGQEQSQELFVRNRSWYQRVRPPLSSTGVLPFVRYVIREKGKVEIGMGACALCHTRVLPNGAVLEGGPGNFPFDAAFADTIKAEPQAVAENRLLMEELYWKPWAPSDVSSRLKVLDSKSLATLLSGRPPGVMTRHRLSLDSPVQIPDLIGVQYRAYLDHTGLQLHRNIGDLMRYAALNQGGDDFARFGEFVPMAHVLGGQKVTPQMGDRYSDEQLYALALYVYSLHPPANPRHADEQTRRGSIVFANQGCANCHPAPLYTNNKLTPAVGFRVPEEHRRRYNILPVVVGTDPAVTMETRRGTGYYKVPSLLGLWYRTPLGHSGWVSTLEEWFDPKRLNNDYVPTGFIPPNLRHGAVKGHEFGLSLSQEDKAAMIAFLRML